MAGPRQSTRGYSLAPNQRSGDAVLAVRILAAQAEALEALPVDEVANAKQREADDGRRDLVGPERLCCSRWADEDGSVAAGVFVYSQLSV